MVIIINHSIINLKFSIDINIKHYYHTYSFSSNGYKDLNYLEFSSFDLKYAH